MPDGFVPIFSPAGTGHRAGAVPDPGTSPSDYVLRADATWGPVTPDASAQQHGVQEMTIATGAAQATAGIPFSPTFAGIPVVVLGSSDPSWIFGATGITDGGFILTGMVDVAAASSLSATGSYLAAYG